LPRAFEGGPTLCFLRQLRDQRRHVAVMLARGLGLQEPLGLRIQRDAEGLARTDPPLLHAKQCSMKAPDTARNPCSLDLGYREWHPPVPRTRNSAPDRIRSQLLPRSTTAWPSSRH